MPLFPRRIQHLPVHTAAQRHLQMTLAHSATSLTTASRIARQLDWRKADGSVLCLHIGRDRIDVALGHHPSHQRNAKPLVSIGMQPRQRHNKEQQQLLHNVLTMATTTQQAHCAGVLVGWPLQRDGWCGAACGHALYTMDRWVLPTIATHRVRLGLYTPSTSSNEAEEEDRWGRHARYSRASPKQCHVASQEQYHQHSLSAIPSATHLYTAFLEEYWPHLLMMNGNTNTHATSLWTAPSRPRSLVMANAHV